MTPEKKVKNKVKAWIVQHLPGPLMYYMAPGGPFGRAGTPDVLICWRGLFIVIEVKTENGTLTALQEKTLKEYHASGAIAAVVYGFDEQRLLAIKKLAFEKAAKLQ